MLNVHTSCIHHHTWSSKTILHLR
uniref:Uncharacterized protein n=1 Tax=Arundo donax TaxID=35708 RepID=A0A0A8ZAQ3_ARUDO